MHTTVAGLGALHGCATTSAATPIPIDRPVTEMPAEPETTTFLRTELFIGSQRPDGTAVTDAEFDLFVDKAVTPRFRTA